MTYSGKKKIKVPIEVFVQTSLEGDQQWGNKFLDPP